MWYSLNKLVDGGHIISRFTNPDLFNFSFFLVYISLESHVGAHLEVHRVHDTHKHCISIYRNHQIPSITKEIIKT